MRSAEEQAADRERYKKNPIWKTDFSKPLPVLIENIRSELVQARGHIHDITYGIGWEDRFKSVEGLLDCGLIALYHIKEEIIKTHIKWDDENFGPSVPFNSRGIGLEWNLNCFICGSHIRNHNMAKGSVLHNIAAFVRSKSDGEQVVKLFSEFWLGAEKTYTNSENGAVLDYREREPNYIQVKIGACDKHVHHLQKLHDITSVYKVIRSKDISDIRAAAVDEEKNAPSQKQIITAIIFKEKTGEPPSNDDLERVNCEKAGQSGHKHCGWCEEHDEPRFMCGCEAEEPVGDIKEL